MTLRAWTVDNVERGPTASKFELSIAGQVEGPAMKCVITAYRNGQTTTAGSVDLRIKFVNPTVGNRQAQAHACAEAARLLAVIWDTIGDLGRSEDEQARVVAPRLDVDPFGPQILIHGPDALIVVAPFFGDDACDELVSSPIFQR